MRMNYDWLLAGIKENEIPAKQKQIYAFGYAFLLLYALAAHVSVGVSSIAMGGGILTLVILLLAKRGRANLTAQQALISKFFFLFCFSVGITSILSHDPAASLAGAIGMAGRFTPMFLAMFFLKSSKQLKWVIAALLASVFIADIVAIIQLIKNEQTRGLVNNRIYFANQLLPMIILAVAFFCERSYSLHLRGAAVFIAVITAGVLIFSLVRGVWVAALAVYLVFILVNKKIDRRMIIQSGVLALAALACFWLNPELSARLKSITDLANRSNIERIYMWQSAWKMFADSPLYGLGFQQFGHYYMPGSSYLMPMAKYTSFAHAHNVFLTFLAETGLIGTAAFLGFFTAASATLYKNYRQEGNILSIAAFLAVAGFLLGGLTDNVFAMPTVMRLIALFIGIGVSKAALKRQAD
jgi:O-antigen ligase